MIVIAHARTLRFRYQSPYLLTYKIMKKLSEIIPIPIRNKLTHLAQKYINQFNFC